MGSDPDLVVHLDEVEEELRLESQRRQAILGALLANPRTIVVGIELGGRIGFCNAAATDATGLLTGDSIIEFSRGFDPEELNRVLGEFASGADEAHWKADLETASAGLRHFEFTMTANRERDEVTSFSVIGYDVTELRQVEGALVEGQAFLQEVIDASPDAIQVADRAGTIALSNRVARDLIDGSQKRFTIRSESGRTLEPGEFPLNVALQTGESCLREVVTDGPNGERRWETHATPIISETGEVSGAVAVSRDITEAASLREAAAERLGLIRSMLQSTADAVVAVDTDLNVRFVNRRATELFGYLAEEMNILDSPADILSVEGEPPSPENLPLERSLRGEENVQVELVMSGHGEGRILAGLSNPIRDAAGNITGAVGVYRDVTEQRETESREATRRQFILQMLDSLTDPVAALNILTDEEYLNDAARNLGIPGPGSDLPLPFTRLDGSPLPENILFEAMAGNPRSHLEMLHRESGRVFVASTHSVDSDEGVLGGVFTARDITDLRGAIEQLEIQSAAMEATITAMFITDDEGNIEWVNRAFTEMTGFTAAEAIGQNPRILKSGLQGPAHYQQLWETILDGRPWQGRVTNRRANGGHVIVEQWVTPITDADGKITHFISVQDDVTAQVEAEEAIRHMATHDPLTDLPNRRVFLEHLEQAIARAHRGGGSLGVLMMDLDRFKDVNDTLGHPAGDQLLREVAARLRSRMRGTDIVARLGGDEFAVIVDESDLEGVRVVARDIIVALGKEFSILNSQVRTGTTIGIAMLAPGTTAEQLLDRADLALYAAKESERGTLQVYVPEMGDQTRQRSELAAELRAAISEQRLSLQFQPTFDIGSGEVTSVEALLRWHRSDGSVLYPNDFLPAASEAGLLPGLGRWVLEAACSQVAAWQAAGAAAPPIAINVTPHELRSRGWGRTLGQALARHHVDPSSLAIEVTEAGLLVATEDNLATLIGLRQKGLHLTLDDFGTGASSLVQFRRLPIDRIKLDRSFVRDVSDEAASEAVIRASALLSDSVGAKLVAKGAESIEQLTAVHRLGAQEVQGFILERPLDAEEVVEHFNRRHSVLDGDRLG